MGYDDRNNKWRAVVDEATSPAASFIQKGLVASSTTEVAASYSSDGP